MRMLSRTVMGALLGAVALTNAASAQGTEKRFPDVPETHWAFDAVHQLAQRGVLEGYPDGTFAGGRAVTRYEASLALKRSLRETQRIIDQFVNLPPRRNPPGPPGPQGPQGKPGPQGEPGTIGPAGAAPAEWGDLLAEQTKLRESFTATQQSFTSLRDELRALRGRLSDIQLNLEPVEARTRPVEKKAPRAPLGF